MEVTDSDQPSSLLLYGIIYVRKKFMMQANSALCCKCLTIVIYDHNGYGQYYKTTIMVNLALAKSINFDLKVRL